MRIYLIVITLILTLQSGFSQTVEQLIKAIPNPRKTNNSWIYQEVDVLQDRRVEMDAMLDELERQTGVEVAVVVMATIGNNIHEEFATELFNHWGIGKKDRDNGVLILHILDQRKIKIETGYGMEGILPDIYCKRIIDEITVPYFKANNFPDGHYWMAKAVTTIASGTLIPDFTKFPTSEFNANNLDISEEVEQKKNELALKYRDEFTENLYLGFTLTLITVVLLIVMINLFKFLRGQKLKDPFKQYFFVQKRDNYVSRMVGVPLMAFGGYSFFTFDGLFIPAIALIFGFAAWSFFPWSMFFQKTNLGALRTKPRICGKCSRRMKRLPENQEDEHLSRLMQAEEKVGLVDYDVWACSCGNTRVDNYKSGRRARTCPKCKEQTYALVKSHILKEASTISDGMEKEFYECGMCAHKNEIMVTIPRYVESSSDSSSSDWSSSSSDFGGGSSGGGGASGDY